MNDDAFVRHALDEAVSDVEPVDRLDAIRSRTGRAVATSGRRWYAVAGAALAAAAVVVAVAVVATGGADRAGDPPVAGPSPSASGEPTPVEPPTRTTPVYYAGPGPDGTDGTDVPQAALYRYFEPEGDPLELLMRQPSDPDYRTLWPAGSLRSFEVTTTAIVVSAVSEAPEATDLAHQQLVYTLQAALGSRLPVELVVGSGGAAGTVVDRADAIDVLAHVSISDPGERYAYAGSFVARGTGTGFEGNVACRLEDASGSTVWSGATIAGTQDRFARWSLDVDLTGVPAGAYVFACSTEDPSGGDGSGPGTFTDTRTIFVT